MTLSLSSTGHSDLCHGWIWSIEDENALAEQVARVALGQYRHVSRILQGATAAGPTTGVDLAAAAIKLLTVENDADPWHRDGWIFQTISWIAANMNAGGAATRPPQIRKADKGFDGMQLELSGDGKSVVAITVFEDKATDKARHTIRTEVWPGIEALEAGERINELTHEVSAILEAQQRLEPELDVDAAISNILWKQARRYRVSITVGSAHAKEAARATLFKGFDEKAPGEVSRRRAETLYLPELRTWMEKFAQLAIAHVRVIAANV